MPRIDARAAFLPPKMIESFIESGVGRVGDEAERQMTSSQIDKALRRSEKKALPVRSKSQSPG
jgi:hypothetical protein